MELSVQGGHTPVQIGDPLSRANSRLRVVRSFIFILNYVGFKAELLLCITSSDYFPVFRCEENLHMGKSDR